MNDDIDFVAVAGECFVDRIVDQLLHHVMQPGPVVRVADVHPGTFANGLQALQDLDAPRVVGFFTQLRRIVARRIANVVLLVCHLRPRPIRSDIGICHACSKCPCFT